LILLTMAHFIVNYLVPEPLKRSLFLKEIFVAVVVSLGIASTTLVGDFKTASRVSSFPFWIFLFINLSNIILFSLFDKEADDSYLSVPVVL